MDPLGKVAEQLIGPVIEAIKWSREPVARLVLGPPAKKKLGNRLQIAPGDGWVRLAALMGELGYDLGDKVLQRRTVSFLMHIPDAHGGPARLDRATAHVMDHPLERKWALVRRAGP